jgi:hypothetical protein
MPRARSARNNSVANIGFEAKLWLDADFTLPSLLPSTLYLQTFGRLANPPFNDSDWFRTAMREAQNPKQGRLTCRVWEDKDDDVRWQYGVPPRGNANFAWVQHFIHHLAPTGMAGSVPTRFFFWMKHGLCRAYSREETGCAFLRIPGSVFDAPRFSVAA